MSKIIKYSDLPEDLPQKFSMIESELPGNRRIKVGVEAETRKCVLVNIESPADEDTSQLKFKLSLEAAHLLHVMLGAALDHAFAINFDPEPPEPPESSPEQ